MLTEHMLKPYLVDVSPMDRLQQAGGAYVVPDLPLGGLFCLRNITGIPSSGPYQKSGFWTLPMGKS
jgi:hypothetical protein